MTVWKINFLPFNDLLEIRGIGRTTAKRIVLYRKALSGKITEKSLKLSNIRLREKSRKNVDFTPNTDPGFFEDEEPMSESSEEDEDDTKSKNSHLSHFPKSISFNGKGNWSCFKKKFTTFVAHEDCNEKTNLVYLSLALEDKASVFYEKENARNYFTKLEDGLRILELRFENPDREKAAMLQLRSSFQMETESSRDFEDRLSDIAYRAYPLRNAKEVEQEILCQFQVGLYDSKAKKFLSLNEPRNLESAHDMLAKIAYSRTICQKHKSRKESPLVRKVRASSSDSSSSSEESDNESDRGAAKVRQINKGDHKHFLASKESNPMLRMEKQMSEMCENMKQMTKQLSVLCSQNRPQSNGRSRPNSFSRSNSKSLSPATRKRNVTCDFCSTKGHYFRDCETMKTAREKSKLENPKETESVKTT